MRQLSQFQAITAAMSAVTPSFTVPPASAHRDYSPVAVKGRVVGRSLVTARPATVAERKARKRAN